MTEETFTLKEIAKAFDAAYGLRFDYSHLEAELTTPKFAEGQVMAELDNQGNASYYFRYGTQASAICRPLTAEEAGPHLVPRAEFDKLREFMRDIAEVRDYEGAAVAHARKALDAIPEELK